MTRIQIAFLSLMVVFFSAGLPVCPSFGADKPLVIRVGHMNDTEQPMHLALLRFGEIISKNTDGRIEVKVFPAGQLGSTTAQLANVKMGSQEMFLESVLIASRIQSDFWALTVPFLITNIDQARKIYTGPIVKEMCEKFAKGYGVRVMASNWERGNRYIVTKVPVAKLSDIKGLKIRVPTNPMFVKCWTGLGASPTPMEIPEIYMGLQQGIVAGAEFPVDAIYSKKYYEIGKFMTLSDHLFDFTGLFINDKFFQNLPPNDRKVVEEAGVEAGVYQNKVLHDYVKTIMEKMKKEGVTYIEMPDSEKEKWAAVTEKVAMEEEAAGKWPKGLISRIRAVK